MRLHQSGYVLRLRRVRLGTERAAAVRLREEGRAVFIALGRYDLLVLDETESLDSGTDRDLDIDTFESQEVICGLTFPDYERMPGLLDSPVIGATFLRLRPVKCGLATLEDEIAVASTLREIAPEAAILHSGGTAEVILLHAGSSIDIVLSIVRDVRRSAHAGIAGSTTIVGFHPGRLEQLRDSDQVVTHLQLSCRPSCERAAMEAFGVEKARYLFGPLDIVAPPSSFRVESLQALLDARANDDGSVIDTSVALSLPLEDGLVDSGQVLQRKYGDDVRSAVAAELDDLRNSLLKIAQPTTAAALAETASNLAAAAAGAELGALGLEHLETLCVLTKEAARLTGDLEARYDDLAVPASELEHGTWVRALAHSLAASISQRSPGTDPGYELAPSGRALAARSPRMHAAISTCLWWPVSRWSDQLMPMCALFGDYSSPVYRLGGVGLPDAFLRNPIEEWWRTTHEAGHAVSWALGFMDTYLESRQLEYLEALSEARSDISSLDMKQLVEELFAQWFDYAVAFAEDREAYQKAIWSGWLRVPIVWDQPVDYLSRSLALWVYPDLDEWRQKRDSREASIGYLRSSLDELLAYLKRDCPGFTSFDERLDEGSIEAALTTVNTVSRQALTALSRHEEELKAPIPEYEELDAHVAAVLRGEVVADPILNPPRVVARLRQAVEDEHGGATTLGQEMALVLSLWNTYRLMCADGLPALTADDASGMAESTEGQAD